MTTDRDGNEVAQPPLSSLWGELSPYLIASFWEVDIEGNRIDNNVTVKAPIIDGGTLEIQTTWQSEFENSGAQNIMPGLFRMLQSGSFQPVVDASFDKNSAANKMATDALKQFVNRTGVTKLNSTKVFNSSSDIDAQITLLFRAWRDPVEEVWNPFNQLMLWLLPVELAKSSTLPSRSIDVAKGKTSLIDGLLPSKTPVFIAMKYKNFMISPMVILSIGVPITSPIDKDGRFIELVVPLKIATLTAIDRNDWTNYSKLK